MLYTSSLAVFKKIEMELKPYYLTRNCGNDAVIPDQSDLEQYGNGLMTWQGFKVNYLAKLMRSEAVEWMRKVSREAVSEDIVLVSYEEDAENRYRILFAQVMMNMFSGQMKLHYKGELMV